MEQTIPKKGSKRLSVDELLKGETCDSSVKTEKQCAEDEIVQDDSFSYEGYQVVRREFFAHINEPSICFNQSKVYVNKACLRRMPDVSHVQILVNSAEKKLVIRPSGEDEKDAFLWCSVKNGVRNPKQITCRVFFAKIVSLMSWNADYRYKILGKVIRSGEEMLVVFHLNAAETYPRVFKEGEKPKSARRPVFPAEWENQFGLPVEEHRKLQQVNIFNVNTVFEIQDSKKQAEQISEATDTGSKE